MANLGNFRAYINADCKGDKIKLPESSSQRLLSIPNITYPLCFELSVPISREDILNAMQNGLPKPERTAIHCGVLDFTAGEGCICLPQWIMENLHIKEADLLNVSNITLPKGRFVRLQPHSVLKDVKTKQKLESSLRNFTTLTANTTITIQSMDNLKLNVLQVKPDKNNLNSIQIIDTDLVVEFEAAADGTTDTHQHFERNLQINNSDQKHDIVDDKVKKGEYRFYKLALSEEGIENLKIIVTPSDDKYDLDLYASWDNYEPGTNTDNYDYHCVEHGAAQIIVNLNENHNNDSKYLYLSVHGFEENHDAENKQDDIYINYTLSVENISMNDMEIKELYRASSLQTHDEKLENNQDLPVSPDENKQFCTNCHRFVNKWSFDRHYQHCIKQFCFCNSCKKVIKINDIENHNKTLHNDLKCKMCAEMIPGGKQTLIAHQKHECLNRPITCNYCYLPFAFCNFEEHENMCGARTEQCIHCNQYIALSLIQQHTADVHGAEYEAPSGIARLKSDDSIDYEAINLGGFGAPERNYDALNENNNNDIGASSTKERWICSSCDYNNRPNHTQCKICKAKRTKYMKKVSEIEDGKKILKKKDNIDKIGGNMDNIPQRNYENMLNKNENSSNYEPNIKAPLIQYNNQQNNDMDASEVIVSSGINPQQIPQRDYDKMLNAEDIDDTAAFIKEQNENDAAMQMDEINEDMALSTNVDTIPDRDYDHMLKQQKEIQYDENMEQQELIQQLTKQFEAENKHKKGAQYRSETAVVPDRNYDKMLSVANDNDINMELEVETKKNDQNEADIVMATSRSGYWLCPSADCDHLNRATRNNCSVCHTLKPTYKRTAELFDDSIDNLGLENRWVCKNCDGLNKGSRNKCVYCKEVKSYKPNSKFAVKKMIEASKKSKVEGGIFYDVERWVCPNKECNFLNKGSRLQCQVCHSQRKDTHIVWGDKAKDVDKNEGGILEKKQERNVSDVGGVGGNKKAAYSHPLEARMMGMDVDEIHNVKVVNKNDIDESGDGVMEWPCPICTLLNKGGKCDMCGCPKDAK